MSLDALKIFNCYLWNHHRIKYFSAYTTSTEPGSISFPYYFDTL